MTRAAVRSVVAAAALCLHACTGSAVVRDAAPELAMLRMQGYRVAVMPFRVSAPEDGFLTGGLAPVGAAIALQGSGGALPMRAMLGAAVRDDFVKWFVRSRYEVVPPWRSDTELAHAGWTAAQMADPSRAAAAAAILQVDGVLYGDVTRWNRNYYVVQSVADVMVEVELRHGTDGRTLYHGERTEQLGAGITGGPTGYVSAATEPIAGLRDSTLQELSRTVTRGLAMDLDADVVEAGATPAVAPQLAVVAVLRGQTGVVRGGERVEVLAIGTPGCDVRFDLGRLRVGVPMVQEELQPDPLGDRAVYRGSYIVQPGERARGLPLSCTIRAKDDLRARASRLRWDGALDLGE